MSISNLVNSDINSVYIDCTVSGAITGTTTINFRRLDNIVYCSLNTFSGTANNTVSSIVLTPNTTVPSQFTPLEGLSRVISLTNLGGPVVGLVAIPTSLATLTFTIAAGGNFNTNAGIQDNVILWRVNSV